MQNLYKGFLIESTVYPRPKGQPFSPRAVVIKHLDKTRLKPLSWRTNCKTKVEAERLSIELAKRAIDDGQVQIDGRMKRKRQQNSPIQPHRQSKKAK